MSVELPSDVAELKDALTERFVSGIRASFTPCPLIGPKWFQGFPQGQPADFRFFGVGKLAKAVGKPADTIIEILMKNVSLEGLPVNVKIRGGKFIDVNRKKGT
ncbi:MAG: hypothetical protein JXA11_11970 [Phycisphaerae bacterium]|nr:hypothetical protein [Phycisphaerae bacterium]